MPIALCKTLQIVQQTKKKEKKRKENDMSKFVHYSRLNTNQLALLKLWIQLGHKSLQLITSKRTKF